MDILFFAIGFVAGGFLVYYMMKTKQIKQILYKQEQEKSRLQTDMEILNTIIDHDKDRRT